MFELNLDDEVEVVLEGAVEDEVVTGALDDEVLEDDEELDLDEDFFGGTAMLPKGFE